MNVENIKFGLNHMVCPSFSPMQLLDAAKNLGIAAVELRNDVGDNSINDVTVAREVAAKAVDLGLEVRSVNALYPFNIWNGEREAHAQKLAELARACGATGLVMCPLNEGRFVEDTPEKAEGLRTALAALKDILVSHGLQGFVEPLGFPVSSLRFKGEALAAIDDVEGRDVFTLVHDTFHHTGASEEKLYANRTGLVHISGLEDANISFAEMLDEHRVLVGPKDRLGNIAQLRALYADGYDGVVSFEPFAREVQHQADPIAAVKSSMAYVRNALAH